jgi:hypothetical protein
MSYTPLETQSPNGGVENGAYQNATSDFVVINTVINHTAGDIGAPLPTAEENTQKLFEMIMTTTNVKYINISSAVVDLSVSANRTALGLGTNFNQAATTVYTIKFMAEQIDFFNIAAFNALIEGVMVPLPTAGVPTTSGTVTLSAYEVTDAAATNLVATKYNLGTNGY